jgi:hypothetical protein
MDDPRQLGAGAVARSSAQIFDGLILDDAVGPGRAVRCTRPRVDSNAATDPMPWKPFTAISAGGEFWPKRGDRAVLVYPIDGPPVIVEWWPAEDAVPDVPL